MTSWRLWLLAFASGVLLPLGFPGFDVWPLAWVAFVPLLAIADEVKPAPAAAFGLVAGTLGNCIGYFWLVATIEVYGGLPQLVSWLLVLMMCLYQGLVFAAFTAGVAYFRQTGHTMLWSAPLLLVAIETVMPMVIPVSMGSCLHHQAGLIQVVDIFGPSVLAAVLVLINLSIYVGVVAVIRHRRPCWSAVLAAPVVIAVFLAYGAFRIAQVDRMVMASPALDVGIVQPNLGMFEKWRDPWRTLEQHRQPTRELEAAGAELVIWPEAAYVVRPIDAAAARLPDELAHGLQTPLLFGALTRKDDNEYNAAVMAGPSGQIAGVYEKVHLLAFSETLPGGRLFSWVYDLIPLQPRLRPGSGPQALPIEVRGKPFRIAPLICFEDILPGYARTAVIRTRAHLLVNLTNDAWFGDSPAAKIHLNLAKFRAVELRRYLVRATNSGVSAVVDPCGRVVVRLPASESAARVAEVRLLEGTTVYGRLGNVIDYICVLAVISMAWRSRRRGAKLPRKER